MPTESKYDPNPEVTTIVENVGSNEAKNAPITKAADATGYCKIWALALNSQATIVQMKEMNPPIIP